MTTRYGLFGIPKPPLREGCIDWYKTPELQLLKALAYWVRLEWPEQGRSRCLLWDTCDRLLPLLAEHFGLGEGVTLDAVQQQVFAEQGLELTPDKLYHRAVKAVRYDETSSRYVDLIHQVYSRLPQSLIRQLRQIPSYEPR